MTPSSLSELTECAGAVVDSSWPVAKHYGNPLAEQKALLSNHAIVDLSHRSVLQVHGPDRLSWLDAMLSQKLDHLALGSSAEALLLDPHGHVEQVLRVIEDGDKTWLLCDEGRAEQVMAFLDRMIFSAEVELSDVSAEVATLGWFGHVPEALVPLLMTSAGEPVIWHDPWSTVQDGGWQYRGTNPESAWNYSEGLIARSHMSAVKKLVDEGQLQVAGLAAWDALRIAAWRPRIVTEGDEKLLPHEVDWLRSAVHLNKGCYRGQETVAKVHNVGHPPRRLVFLDLDGSGEHDIHHGDALTLANGDRVGAVTSVGLHWQEGPIGLGLIKRTFDETADIFVTTPTARVPARQLVIVPSDAGATVSIPPELRQRNRP